jgi:hypothetical protein
MRPALLLFLIASLLLPAAGGAGPSAAAADSQAGDPITLEEYWRRVTETRQAAADLEHQSEAMALSRLDQLASAWEAITQVSLPDGTLVELDHSELAALLRQEPPHLAIILGRLDALIALHERFPDGIFTLEDLGRLKAILADPRFQWEEAKPSPLAGWWESFWKKVGEWLDELFGDGLGLTLPVGPIMTWALGILLVLILAFAGRGLFAGLVRDVELAAQEPCLHEALTSEAAFQRAEALSRGGDLRSAVRYLYLSALLLLDERGLLRYDRSRTNLEYLRTVRDSPDLVRPLRSVIEIFDRVWYGFEAIDPRTYQEYVERVDELRKQRT